MRKFMSANFKNLPSTKACARKVFVESNITVRMKFSNFKKLSEFTTFWTLFEIIIKMKNY